MAEPQTTSSPASPAVPSSLEAEADGWAGDSSIGEDDLASSKASITSSIQRYREENGRTYHGYKVGLASAL